MARAILRLMSAALAVALLSSAAAAAWQIEELDGPHSRDRISLGRDTIQLTRVTDGLGKPVSKSRVEGSEWTYNYSFGNFESFPSMDYLGDGYWYARFSPAQAQNTSIGYVLIDHSPSGDLISNEEDLSVGNLTVNILTDTDTRYKPGESLKFEAEVVNNWNNNIEAGSEVFVQFTNGSWSSNPVQLGYDYNTGTYTNLVTMPSGYGEDYIVHVDVSKSGVSYQAPYGSSSDIVSTYPKDIGSITSLSTDGNGCNNQSFFTECERGATVNVSYDISEFNADDVTLSLALDNGFNKKMYREIEMQKSLGEWKAGFKFPDVDTGRYKPWAIMKINTTIDGIVFTKTRNISYKSFRIVDKSDPKAYQGENYKLKLLFGKYFSLQPLNTSRLDRADIAIRDPDGQTFNTFSLVSMVYDEKKGLFTKEVPVPVDAKNGSYVTEVRGYNTYDNSYLLKSGFEVKPVQAVFNLSNSTINADINKTGPLQREVTITNKGSNQRTVKWTTTGGIKNFTTVGNGSSISLGGKKSVTVPVKFDIGYVKDYAGKVVFYDSDVDFNKSVDVTFNAPECGVRSGALCIDQGRWINVTASEPAYKSKTVNVMNLGDIGGFQIQASTGGEISRYLTVSPSNTFLTDTSQVTLNYSIEDKGEFTGNVDISGSEDGVRLYTKLVSSAERMQPGIDTTSYLDIGSFSPGETISRTIFVNNTGDVAVDSLSASSPVLDASIGSGSISTGQNRTFTLTLNNLQSGTGTVTVTASTSKGDVERSISISGSTQGTRKDVTRLENRISSLRDQATSSSIEAQLDSLSTELSDIEGLYDQGSYQQANQRYNEVESQLNDIENRITTGTDTNPSNDTGLNSPDGPGSSQEKGGIGRLLVPVAVVLFVLVLLGFIVYTSYVPEEGDPLYDLLGNEP